MTSGVITLRTIALDAVEAPGLYVWQGESQPQLCH